MCKGILWGRMLDMAGPGCVNTGFCRLTLSAYRDLFGSELDERRLWIFDQSYCKDSSDFNENEKGAVMLTLITEGKPCCDVAVKRYDKMNLT
jgi:hypothetical protein